MKPSSCTNRGKGAKMGPIKAFGKQSRLSLEIDKLTQQLLDNMSTQICHIKKGEYIIRKSSHSEANSYNQLKKNGQAKSN